MEESGGEAAEVAEAALRPRAPAGVRTARGGDAFFGTLFARASRLRARPVGLQSTPGLVELVGAGA